ncbi:MAG TPA: class I SAM-dependent methyltransferase [Pyrinomonadaceae bacterium]|jgi:SAM-dependent methyltransferase|nr:class I SAM-dependent methyltransferase [Pyrinomonadaceae bacterium]
MKTKTVKSADPIGEFYTNHPYPPPIDNLDRARDMWQDEKVHRAEFHLFWPHKESRADLDVLVAGCGTWQSAKFAVCHPNARVSAIDISTTSIEHTGSLKQKYDLTNLGVRQLPIENVADLDQRFDLIVSTGVLHHLEDPDEGLRSLRSVLKPDGAMYLMLYAPYGRAGVYMLQDYCRRLGVGTSEREINELSAVLKVLPQHHPLVSMLRGAREALDADALVDALLNPRDRTYSVPELFDFLERNDLSFTRWYWQAPYSPRCGSITQTPHADRLMALPEREQYAEMELLRGLISNHDFVAQQKDGNAGDVRVRFDDESHLRYVPIRRPWTICVEERLPPGAAAVLLNQTHLFPDLYLMIDVEEKQFFEAIDGHRNIAEIAALDEKADWKARSFFEKLWWHDQVVFDTSKA